MIKILMLILLYEQQKLLIHVKSRCKNISTMSIPIAAEAVKRVCPMTRGQPTAKVTNIQCAIFTEVSLL